MDPLSVQLAQLETAQLVRRLGEQDLAYLFEHALTEEAAYDSLLRKTQRETHLRVARAFEHLYADDLDAYAALLAHHYGRAGQDTETARFAQRAGDIENELGTHLEAKAHYDQALQALSRLPDNQENRRLRLDLIVKGASVSFASESPEKVWTRLEEAESLARTLASGIETQHEDRLRFALLYYWMGRISFYRNNGPAALDYFSQAAQLAQEADDRDVAALVSSLMGRIMLFRGEFGKAEPLFARALGPLEHAHNWAEWILANVLGSSAAAARGRYKEAVTAAEHGLDRAHEMQYVNGMTMSYNNLALIHLMGGDTDRMFEMSRICLELSLPVGNWLPSYSAFCTLALAESRRGQHEAAVTSVARARSIAAQLGGHLFLDDWLSAFEAEMALNAGQLETAITRARETIANDVDGIFAQAFAERVWAQALGAFAPPQWDEAVSHLAASLDLFLSGEAQLEAARTQVVWGTLCRERGDIVAARELFEKAVAQFESSELAYELEQAKDLLDSLAN